MVIAPEFLFDVGSPNAFLVHRALPRIEDRTGVRFEYVPVLLGGIFKATGNQSPAVAYAAIPSKLAYERLEMRRFIAKHDVAGFRFNPHFPVNTLQLMRGAVAAQRLGCLPAFLEAVFKAMWIDGLKMDQAEVAGAVLQAAGLPVAELTSEAGSDEVKQALASNTRRAVERGVFGIPTLFVGGEMFFGKERLGQVEEAIKAAMDTVQANRSSRS
jgi:2-hydroxychromene-2-carboxylate isomerase